MAANTVRGEAEGGGAQQQQRENSFNKEVNSDKIVGDVSASFNLVCTRVIRSLVKDARVSVSADVAVHMAGQREVSTGRMACRRDIDVVRLFSGIENISSMRGNTSNGDKEGLKGEERRGSTRWNIRNRESSNGPPGKLHAEYDGNTVERRDSKVTITQRCQAGWIEMDAPTGVKPLSFTLSFTLVECANTRSRNL